MKDLGKRYKFFVEAYKRLSKYLDVVSHKVKRGETNGAKLFRELKEAGCRGSYNSLNRYLNTLENYKCRYSHRFETEPGEQAQVDWGHFGKVEIDHKVYKLYCFVYILGYSRMLYAEFTVRQDLSTFIQCHIHAFEKLGKPNTVLYDNVKTVVLKRERLKNRPPRIYYNPAFLDFSQYYGFQVKLCPPYWPRSKGKVEASVKYIKNNFLQHIDHRRKLKSINELNGKLGVWLTKTANSRIHKTTGEVPYKRWVGEKSRLDFLNNLPRCIPLLLQFVASQFDNSVWV